MNRVWKRFLTKVAKGVGAVAYVLSSMLIPGVIAGSMGYDPEAGIMAGAFVMVIFPMIAFLLRDTYRDSKREVDRENEQMMRTLKGDR